MENAVKEKLTTTQSIRQIAKKYDICHVTLGRYIKKFELFNQNEENLEKSFSFKPNYDVNKVFDNELEQQLPMRLFSEGK